jgi:hypothetical protein
VPKVRRQRQAKGKRLMTNLIKKLESLQCGCDDFAGKTIAKAIRERGYYYLLFTDGTWCHTDYQLGVGEMLESLLMDDEKDWPFVQFGLATVEEIEQHYKDAEAERTARDEKRRRQYYERLRREFE